jgi:hypothetical protein
MPAIFTYQRYMTVQPVHYAIDTHWHAHNVCYQNDEGVLPQALLRTQLTNLQLLLLSAITLPFNTQGSLHTPGNNNSAFLSLLRCFRRHNKDDALIITTSHCDYRGADYPLAV